MENIFEEFLREIEEEKEKEKPCANPYICGDKIKKKVVKALKDIDNNRNHSWAIEMYNRNASNLNNIALFYRGTKITYREMFEKAYIYAKSLKSLGFNKGNKVPICITNTPEFVYLFLATSLIGAEANIVGEWFDKDYLTQILNDTKSKTIFIDDISYEAIKDSIKEKLNEIGIAQDVQDMLWEVQAKRGSTKEKQNKKCQSFQGREGQCCRPCPL